MPLPFLLDGCTVFDICGSEGRKCSIDEARAKVVLVQLTSISNQQSDIATSGCSVCLHAITCTEHPGTDRQADRQADKGIHVTSYL